MRIPIRIPTVLAVCANLIAYASLSRIVLASPIKVLEGKEAGVHWLSRVEGIPHLHDDGFPKNVPFRIMSGSDPDSNPNLHRPESSKTTLSLHPNPYLMVHAEVHTHTNTDPDAGTDIPVVSPERFRPPACREDIAKRSFVVKVVIP